MARRERLIQAGRRLRILVTAGPTREFLDDVRFLTNLSSGRMGYAVAGAATRAGHEVTLVSGPTALKPPRGVKRIRVESARQMARAVNTLFRRSDAVVMTAAVSDYRPARRARGKIKKGPALLAIRLVRNPDILAGLGRRKGGRILVGFALEASRGRERAAQKLRAKNLDLIVLDSPRTMGSERAAVEILDRSDRWQSLANRRKTEIGEAIVRRIETLVEARR